MRRQGDYLNILLGFWFILILSDSLEPIFEFAKNAKHVFIVIFAGILLTDRRILNTDYSFIKIFIPFFILALIAMMYSLDVIVSAQKTLSYFMLYLAVPIYVLHLYQERGKEVFKILVQFAIFILFVGVLLKYTFPDMALLEGRYRGIFGNPNQVGIFVLLIFLLFRITKDFWPDLFTKWEVRFIYLVLALSIYWSGSRNAMISIAIFLLLYRFYKIAPALGFMVLLITAFLFKYINDNLVELVIALNLEEYFRLQTAETGSGRYIAWAFAWEKLQEFFFIGRGFANDELTMRPNYAYLSKLGHQGGVHNSYISLWMDVGLMGVIAYFIPFVLIFIRAAKRSRVALPVMFTLLFTIIFESWLVGSQNPVTIILLMILSMLFYILPQISNKQSENSSINEQVEPDVRAVPGSSVS